MSNQKILARGAEAIIYKSKNKIVKDRIPKGYRHPELDSKLRKRRTKAEAKLLTKASKIINVPKVLEPNSTPQHQKYEIIIDYISGKRLSDNLEKLKYKKICKQIGKNIALLHNAGLIHGDLTTSNMILTSPYTKSSGPKHPSSQKQRDNFKPRVYFIDFGLGFHSDRIEDKAVDLHLISEALEAKHHSIYKEAFKSVLEGYKKSDNYSKIIAQLKKVEKRGRYKEQY